MSNEPSYTNVRMDANSELGRWWRNQSDRDFSMQVLVQLANQKFGKNVDLKAYSLQQMINNNGQNTNPVTMTKSEISNIDKPDNSKETTNQFQTEKQHIINKSANAHKQHESNQVNTIKKITKEKASQSQNVNQDMIKDALFNDDPTPSKPKKKQSFRDQL